ncbi:MAG: ATP-binding cassette domain-containing protein, partial [Pseudomonas aeruginosa]|nr:ATP-binding cassette domain-containing protein [Pseudomonas aeruginosa]
MDSRLSDFLARAESVLARLEPLLPAVREAVDWERSLAARWHRDGRSGYLQPLEVSLDLRLAAGEMLQVVGPNGSGKTSLLRLLSGLMQPTAGEVRLNGRPLAEQRG